MKEKNKNGIYLITKEDVDYDEYDGFVVIAKNRKEAINMVINKIVDIDNIRKVGESSLKSQIVLSSFNAG